MINKFGLFATLWLRIVKNHKDQYVLQIKILTNKVNRHEGKNCSSSVQEQLVLLIRDIPKLKYAHKCLNKGVTFLAPLVLLSSPWTNYEHTVASGMYFVQFPSLNFSLSLLGIMRSKRARNTTMLNATKNSPEVLEWPPESKGRKHKTKDGWNTVENIFIKRLFLCTLWFNFLSPFIRTFT